MKDKILYGYSGIFDKPDDIILAAKHTVDAGYKKFDVNTPYPVHGMDGAMKLPPSKLGYFALVFGLSGALAAVMLTYWTSVLDYPLVIGGKPFYAFPTYVPIIFEVTVLSAAVATVVTMIVIFFKFPNISHPLHGTDYMKKISSDKYGLVIEAADPKFKEESVRELLISLGAKNIEPVYYDIKESGLKVFNPKFIMMLLVIFIAVSGTTYFSLNKLMYMVPFDWMMDQEKVLPQEKSELFSDGFGMRKPAEGSVARGFISYAYKGDRETAEKELVNPLDFTKKNLDFGRKKFDIYCSPCHGSLAKGDSRLNGKFPNPPSLHTKAAREYTDGRIFHIITEGQNIMPSYSSQLTREERWAIVLYVRALQRSLNARESDIQ
jgi:hypothetical protein